MKSYEFHMLLVVDAASKKEALERAKIALDNLKEMAGYSPFNCELGLLESSCTEVEFTDDGEE